MYIVRKLDVASVLKAKSCFLFGPRTNLEVDFVVNGEIAIEAKTTRSATKDDLKGLRAIGDEGAFRHRIFVSDEPRPREVDGISILPWREFISRLWTGNLF